jgi:peptide/nickel transport system substrate-binding protein
MTGSRPRAGSIVIVLVVVGLLVASGDGDGSASTGALRGTRPFSEFRVIEDSVDYLDPALSYTAEGWAPLSMVYLSLLGYRQVRGPGGATVVPVLAENLPRVSRDRRTYMLTLRQGLTYSNGRTVKASDFEYAIERLFRVDSPGVGFFSNIVGATRFAKTRKGGISGIVADDATRGIRIRLAKPQGDFEYILTLPFAALVPAGTPAKDQSTHPIPATGPYLISSYRPSRAYTLARNPSFRPLPSVSATNPDTISVQLIKDLGIALQKTINGQADYDFNAIPIERLASVQRKYGDRLKIYTPADTWYVFMNTRTPPFDKLAVRKAVNLAIDRRALVQLVGGLATPTENILPPTYPQYRKHTLYPHDVAKARALVQQAGAAGAAVTVWTTDIFGFKPTGEYLTDVLGKIGLKATLKVLDPNVYFQVIGNQSTRTQIGISSWYQDYPHPLDWFDTLLNGRRITSTHNNNLSNTNVPAINATIDRLKRQPTLTKRVNAQWAALDRRVMEQALIAPYLNHQQTDFFGSDIDTICYVNQLVYLFEWGHICKKS